jgi:hypothetical protein
LRFAGQLGWEGHPVPVTSLFFILRAAVGGEPHFISSQKETKIEKRRILK